MDITAGWCSCPKGSDGSRCKHQFAAIKKYRLTSQNYLPLYTAEEHKLYSIIAKGKSLDPSFYQSFTTCNASSVTAETVTQNEHGTMHSESSLRQNTLGDITNTIPSKSPSLTKFVTKEEAHSSLDEAFRLLSRKVDANNQNLLRAIVKFSKSLKMKSDSQIETALHLFDSSLAKGNQSLHANSKLLLHKAKKGRINVQAEAVKRRKAGGHGRKALPKGKFTTLKLNDRMLPDKGNSSMKRQHNFTSNTKENVAVSKKAGWNMVSRTKKYLKKRHNTNVKGEIDCKKKTVS